MEHLPWTRTSGRCREFGEKRVVREAARGIHRAALKSRLPTRECPEVHVCTSPLSVASPTRPRLHSRPVRYGAAQSWRVHDSRSARRGKRGLVLAVSDCGSSRDLRRADAPWASFILGFSSTRKTEDPERGGGRRTEGLGLTGSELTIALDLGHGCIKGFNLFAIYVIIFSILLFPHEHIFYFFHFILIFNFQCYKFLIFNMVIFL